MAAAGELVMLQVPAVHCDQQELIISPLISVNSSVHTHSIMGRLSFC